MALFRKAATAALSCALLLALLLALPASPAFAHDTLKRSSPAKNAEVSSVEEIELEYSASVKFPFVVLHDATGKEVALGEPRLDGPLVSAEVPEPLTPGSYVIAWRVVSSDGHPIEGEIPFSVKGSSSASASPAGSAAATTPGAAPGTGAAQPSAAAPEQATGPAVEPAAGRSAEPAGVPGWIWGGLAVLVVLGAFVLFRSSRRRPDREEVNAD